MPTTATGRILAARYLLISKLGEGGMGITYRAWDLQDNVPVVVKMPKPDAQSDGSALRRFAREVDAMRALPHAHIVPIIDHGDDAGCPYVVMRFLPGGSLAEHRRRDGNSTPLANPPGMLHFWLPAVAEALDFIHSRGVLHRDVKPGNIFFDGSWHAFLGDFGIAKVVDPSAGLPKEQTITGTNIAVGTPEYMAPELFAPKATSDGRADQYALAITAYEMLCGTKPFTGTKAHIVMEHLTMPVPPLQTKGLGIPRSLGFAVERALAKKPDDRFATCTEFAQAAIRDVAPLPPEPNVARLMCPSCAAILRMPTTAGGQWGKCPKCKTAMRVASDLSALWLENEEPKKATPVNDSLANESTGFPWPKPISRGPRLTRMAAAVIVVLIGSVLLSVDWSRKDGPNTAINEARERLAAERAKLDAERLSLAVEREQLENQRSEAAKASSPLATDTPPDGSRGRQMPEPKDRAEAPNADASAPPAPEGPPPTVPDFIRDHGDIVSFRGDTFDQPTARDLVTRGASLRICLAGSRLTLAPQAAEPLAAHRGKTIQFCGTTSLSREAAAALAPYPNVLAFERLASLPPDVAAALAAHTGPLFIGGFDEVPAEAALETLRKSAGRVMLPAETDALKPAIEKARNWLVREQKDDGSWECAMRTNDTRVGATALVMLALANAGMRADEPALRKSLDWLRSKEPDETYSVSLQTIVLAILSPDTDRAIIERNVRWLERSQVPTGPAEGSWSYGKEKGTGDNSNSHYALQALHEAARAGATVKPVAWRDAQKYWVSCANPDGSWGYTIGNVAGTGSMTCAGITCTWITSQHTGATSARPKNRELNCCDGSPTLKVITRGLDWLGNRFSVSENPGGGQTWHFYYLAALARVRRFTGHRFIEGHDVVRETTDVLLKAQDQISGVFRGGRIEDPVVATSMALPVLVDCSRPALIAKSLHQPAADSDRHSHDAARLTEAINARLSLAGNTAYSWHILPIHTATDAQLGEAPLLFISSKGNFELGEDAARRLRRFTDAGGLVFAEPACGQSADFDTALRKLVETMFSDEATAFSEVPADHPLWDAGAPISPQDRPTLLGISQGGRLRVLYHPLEQADEPSLSCLWDRSEAPDTLSDENRQRVESALAVGRNIALFAASLRSDPHAAHGLYYDSQGRLERLAKPAACLAPADTPLAKAWADYDRCHAKAMDQISGSIREAIDKDTSRTEVQSLLRLENALASLLEDGLLPKCTDSAGADIASAIESARAALRSAADALREAYETAITTASGTDEGDANLLRRERDEVFAGLTNG